MRKPRNEGAARPSRPVGAGAVITVRDLCSSATRGYVQFGWLALPCALGRSGLKARKVEGDGATPRGSWRPLRVLYRADRVRRPRTGLPVRAIRPDDGWCDHVSDRNYNRSVRHPYAASAEHLWRRDDLYDIVVVLDHNVMPRIQGHGSCIFMHIARPDLAPTAGCIALARSNLLRLLESRIPIQAIDTRPQRTRRGLR